VTNRVKILSEQYKTVKGLKTTLTQWMPGGRPIYGRLPAASEQYQLDFFEEGGRGYVLIPRGVDQFGPGSLYVNQSADRDVLLIEDGVIVWEEGTTPVYKTFVDFRQLGVLDGRYLICYQLIYDDAPEPLPFQVEDYSLAGLDFDVSDSASKSFENSDDAANPWPFPGINLFATAESGLNWQNFIEVVNTSPGVQSGVKPGFPDYEQPLLSWVEWKSAYPWKLDKIRVRTPLVNNVPDCTLLLRSQEDPKVWDVVQTNPAVKDNEGFYWEFETDYSPQSEWRLEWPNQTKISAERLTVSGLIYIPTKPSTPRARAQLAIYPTNLVPESESLCRLAIISVDNYQIPYRPNGELFKDDIREITNKDFEPVADWLTVFWDRQLIDLWRDVKTYSPNYMTPPILLKTSYYKLEEYGIYVEDQTPPLPPLPPATVESSLIGASVSLFPPLPTVSSLQSASVSFFSLQGSPAITDITVEVVDP
jgi:hypothetical protein